MKLSQVAFATAVAASPAPRLRRDASAPVFMPLKYPYDGYPKVRTEVYVGTPAQAATDAIVDTGSANFWVFGNNASLYWGSPYLGVEGPCRLTPEPSYNPANSSTSNGPYPEGRVFSYGGNGKMLTSYEAYNDTVAFSNDNGGGAVAGTTLKNTQFATVNYTLIKNRDDGKCAGVDYDPSILGLSEFTTEGVLKTEGPSFRQNLLEDGAISSSTLSMWFDKAPDAANATYYGTALFGALPPKSKYTGELVQVKRIQPDNTVGYYVPIPEWSVNGLSDLNSSTKISPSDDTADCLIDSGSGQDYLPISQDEFIKATGLIMYSNIPAFNGSCDSMPKDLAVSIKFVGKTEGQDVTIKIPLRNYARGNTDFLGDFTKCGLSLQLDNFGSCTLASPFFSAAVLAVNDELSQLSLAQGGVSTGAQDGVEGLGEIVTIAPGQGLP